MLAAVARGEREAPSPESFYVSTLATLAAARSLQDGGPVAIVAAPDEEARSPRETD